MHAARPQSRIQARHTPAPVRNAALPECALFRVDHLPRASVKVMEPLYGSHFGRDLGARLQ
jgi:hypothetical protein